MLDRKELYCIQTYIIGPPALRCTTELLLWQQLIASQSPSQASAKAALRRSTRHFRVLCNRAASRATGSSSTRSVTRCVRSTTPWRLRGPTATGSSSSDASIARATSGGIQLRVSYERCVGMVIGSVGRSMPRDGPTSARNRSVAAAPGFNCRKVEKMRKLGAALMSISRRSAAFSMIRPRLGGPEFRAENQGQSDIVVGKNCRRGLRPRIDVDAPTICEAGAKSASETPPTLS